MQRRDLLGFALAAAVLPARAQPRTFDVTPWPSGAPMPSLKALDMEGKAWDLSALRGRAVVLNFWATWCPPCRAEMPSLQQMAEIYGPEQLQVLAVNVGEGPRRISQYLQASGLKLTVLLDQNSEIARRWSVSAMPTTYLIDATGQPRTRLRGEVDWTGQDAERLVEPLLPRRGKTA